MKFEKGMRVRVFNTVYPDVEEGNVFDGTVLELTRGGYVRVVFDHDEKYGSGVLYHPKQCRRLRPRKKRVAREVHIEAEPLSMMLDCGLDGMNMKVCALPRLGYRKFREVLPEGGR